MSDQLIWLSPEVLTWNRGVEVWSTEHQGREQRSYQHWNHAERLLSSELDEFRRIDLVGALKRSVDFRVQLLNEVWELGTIPHPDLPGHPFERLQFLGVIRPRMVERLIRLRNAIEHEDTQPPSVDLCADLVDFVWYFLRSTDALIQKTTDQVSLAPPDRPEDWRGTLRSGPEMRWICALSLRLEPALLADAPRTDWIAVRKQPDPFRYLQLDREVREILRSKAAPRPVNEIDPILGQYHLHGQIVGSKQHIRAAARLMLTPF